MHPAGSKSSTLDGGTPAGWRGARAGSLGRKTGCKAYAMPSPPSFRTKHSLLPSFFLFLSPYLSTSSHCTPSVRLLCFLARYTSTIPGHSLLIDLFLPPPLPCVRSSLRRNCSPSVGNAEEEVPGGFFAASSREGL